MVDLKYIDLELEKSFTKGNIPILQPEKNILKSNPTFAVKSENIMPSPQEYKEICVCSAEKFVKRLKEGFRFPCELQCDWPDVTFHICYNQSYDHELFSKTFSAFECFVYNYNAKAEKRGAMQYTGKNYK